MQRKRRKSPRVIYPCADCGVSTFDIGEYYMVQDDIWKHVWKGRRRRPFLCIGCLEARLGRMLVASDFMDARVNDLADLGISTRMRDRMLRERLLSGAAAMLPLDEVDTIARGGAAGERPELR